MNQGLSQAQRLAAYIKVRDQLLEADVTGDAYICFFLQDILGIGRSGSVFAFYPELDMFTPDWAGDYKIWSITDMFTEEEYRQMKCRQNEIRLFVAQLLIEMTRP